MVKPQKLNSRPGKQVAMKDQPQTENVSQVGSGKLAGKVALITGGDSGIGRAVAVAFAKEGAKVAINYLDEDKDAAETKRLVEEQGSPCLVVAGDIGTYDFCGQLVKKVIDEYGQIDVLVNNAAEQHPQKSVEDITPEQLERTFRTNIFSMFYLTQAALKHLSKGSSIINTTSVTAYRGSPELLDYSSTKGAITSYTRSLAVNLAPKDIRINCVAPGPIWTPLVASTYTEDKQKKFGKNTAMGRPGQPSEVAPAYVFLASDESSYITGQSIHVNGGSIVNA